MNSYNNKSEIGSRIQKIRQKRNMTQEYLAEKTNISNAQQISNIERGIAGISLSRFKDICNVLEIESDYLLFGTITEKTETILHTYIKQMTSEQLEILLDIVNAYAKSCGIK